MLVGVESTASTGESGRRPCCTLPGCRGLCPPGPRPGCTTSVQSRGLSRWKRPFAACCLAPQTICGRWCGALKLSHCPLGFKVTILKPGLACGLPEASRTDPQMGRCCQQPLLFPHLGTASHQRPFLFNLRHICKVYGGFSFEKQKIPQVLLFESFFSPDYEGLFFAEV